MANVSRNCGFKPYGEVLQTFTFEAGSTIYPNEAVTLASDGQIDTTTAAADICGVALHYATVGQKILCSVAMNQLYVTQADGVGVAAQTSIGQTMDVVATAANTTYRDARMQLDTSSVGSSQQFLIVGLDPKIDNAFGTSPKLLVMVNQPQLTTGGTDFTSV